MLRSKGAGLRADLLFQCGLGPELDSQWGICGRAAARGARSSRRIGGLHAKRLGAGPRREVVAAPTQLAPPPFADTAQTADVYQEEARRIVAATPVVRWVQPSRHEAISVAGSELVLATRAEVERVDASPA